MRDLIRRRLGVVVIVIVVVVLLSANRITTFLTDLWWFDALGYRGVFTGVLGAQILLALAFGAVLAVIVAANLHVARRLRPTIIPTTPQQAIIERYRQMADPFLPWLILGLAVLFGLTAGAAVSQQWEEFLLWRNGGSFGLDDPQFGRDVGFYVFDLPWLKFVQNWLLTSMILVTLLTGGAHYLLGGIRPEAPTDKVTPGVRIHLSVLLAVVLAVRAWGYWLDRFQLNFSPRGVVTGASYTDVNAELPALNLLLVVSAIAIVLVLYNIRSRGWLLPGAAIALLVLASVILSGIYPAIIQATRVNPQELQREREFIDRNREATLAGYDLEVDLDRFAVVDDFGPEDVEAEQITLTNIRLWDETVLSTTYEELQALRPYYRFLDVDVDRYIIDDEVRQVVLATRELDARGLPDDQWQVSRLIFTHAFGVVASAVNTADNQGQPVFFAKDIPPIGEETLLPSEQPGIYFGESSEPTYSIVNTDQLELDFEDPNTSLQEEVSYAGEGGVPLGNFFRKFAFALRFADPNFLLSGLLNADSRIIWNRDVATRVKKIAPYLTLDRDPYPVVIDGRILWIQDAMTTSANYPYSQRLSGFLDAGEVNYLRNSVKAVVDAYNGTVELYVVDTEDPIVNAWRRAFPGPFRDLADAPTELAAHFRYPQDLFAAQVAMYRRYHIPTTDSFYNQGDLWDLPRDAPRIQNDANLTDANAPVMPAYYLLMRLPGEETEEFVLVQPYVAANRQNMIGWLAARSDPEHYGELFAVQFPSTQTVLGPQQVQARIEQESEISEFITLRSDAGSSVIRGNLLVIPIEQSLLYVEPLFIQGEQSDIPELSQVVAVLGERVVMNETLEGAIAELVGQVPPPVGGDGEPDDGQDVESLAAQVAEAFAAAEAALEQGNLGEFQRQFNRASRLYLLLLEAQGLAPEPEPVPTADPSDGSTEGSGDGEPTPTGTAAASAR